MMLTLCLAGWSSGCGMGTTRDCDWAQPIRPARADHLTVQTQRQMLAHNETGARLCGWEP